MGRAEALKKQSKVSKVSKLEKHKLKNSKQIRKDRNVKEVKKEKKDEIITIDKDENYVLPSNFKIELDDVLLFEKLNELQPKNLGLEKNVQKFNEENEKINPKLDQDVLEVYQKLFDKNRRSVSKIQKR